MTPKQTLPDLIYVDKAALQPHDPTSLMCAMPYLGPGWYPKVSVECCLHTHKLEWSDLKWGITASAHYPGDAIRAALDILESSWSDVSLENPKGEPWRRSINFMIGVWSMRGRVHIKSLFSYGDVGEELWDDCWKTPDAYGAKGLMEFRRVTQVETSATFRPLYDLCPGTEHVRLAQARAY